MKVTVGALPARVPYEGADHVIVTGECPRCGVSPFRAQGVGEKTLASDSVTNRHSRCLECGHDAGAVVAEFDTMWGIEEDRRVLGGPWKVF